MINRSNLTHPTMLCKIYAAMRRATKRSHNLANYGVAYVDNTHGEHVITVVHSRGEANALQFAVGMGNDITALVLSVLREPVEAMHIDWRG